jgi:hypothetical protein
VIEPPKGTGPEYQQQVDTLTGKNWPVVIDSPGDYITRDGRRAKVNEISPKPFTFNCKGYIINMARRKNVWAWTTWKPNGQNKSLGESRDDIVDKWRPPTYPTTAKEKP